MPYAKRVGTKNAIISSVREVLSFVSLRGAKRKRKIDLRLYKGRSILRLLLNRLMPYGHLNRQTSEQLSREYSLGTLYTPVHLPIQ